MDEQETISERANEISNELKQKAAPPPELLEAVRRYYTEQHHDLLRQVAEIEAFLGFSEGSEQLAVRVAKIEAFLGVKVA